MTICPQCGQAIIDRQPTPAESYAMDRYFMALREFNEKEKQEPKPKEEKP